MNAQAKVDIDILERAYVFMLQSKDFAWRVHNQDVLCYFRDTIADMRGWSSEQTQNHFEAIALTIA